MTLGPDDSDQSLVTTAERLIERRRPARWWAAGALVVLLLLVGVLTSRNGGNAPASRSVRAAPDFRLPRLDDPSRIVALSDYRGQPVVVNFWASWCVPCKKEMPEFQAVADDLRGKVQFLGINEQDVPDRALALVARTGVRYPSAFDPQGNMGRAYQVRGLPATAFVSAEGDLLDVHTGHLSDPDLRAAIRRLWAYRTTADGSCLPPVSSSSPARLAADLAEIGTAQQAAELRPVGRR